MATRMTPSRPRERIAVGAPPGAAGRERCGSIVTVAMKSFRVRVQNDHVRRSRTESYGTPGAGGRSQLLLAAGDTSGRCFVKRAVPAADTKEARQAQCLPGLS